MYTVVHSDPRPLAPISCWLHCQFCSPVEPERWYEFLAASTNLLIESHISISSWACGALSTVHVHRFVYPFNVFTVVWEARESRSPIQQVYNDMGGTQILFTHSTCIPWYGRYSNHVPMFINSIVPCPEAKDYALPLPIKSVVVICSILESSGSLN